ncbi:virion protein [Shewanella dokdonensis]|uniref:Virion protein n=1 Tax=Shewanella dokdonensis TaxID=712036 RepID=A0ABX8DEF5_9GAMM|nr:virion protein [Shewanella dokdonensis]QVK23095.1 virion protein [Shewanella dokdonensis]
MMQPRGITNNNPLNIRENKMVDYDWLGEADGDWDPQFEEFTTPFYGIRAAARILRNYRTKYGVNTVQGIIRRWAPPSDNNPTESYIDFVAKNAGVTATQTLGAADYIKVVAAMIRFENGFNPYETSLIANAVSAGME